MKQDYNDLPRYKVNSDFYEKLYDYRHLIVSTTKVIGIKNMARRLNYNPGKFSVINKIMETIDNEPSTYSMSQFKQLKDIKDFYTARNYIVHHINWVGLIDASKDLGYNHSTLSAIYNFLKPQASLNPPGDYRPPEHPEQLELDYLTQTPRDDRVEQEYLRQYSNSYDKVEQDYLAQVIDDKEEQEYLR